jgi:hypothetical protein
LQAEAAITAIKQALAAPVQEPVAWANPNDLKNFDMKVRTNGGPLHTVALCLCAPPAAQPAVDLRFLKQVVGVAIAGLFEHYKEDVARVFDTSTLQDVVEETAHLGNPRVEEIYKRAWEMLATIGSATQQYTPLNSAQRQAIHEQCNYIGSVRFYEAIDHAISKTEAAHGIIAAPEKSSTQ